MPIRLKVAYDGQAANTVFYGSQTLEDQLVASGIADTRVELASDYNTDGARTITAATGTIVKTAATYLMNSSSAQTLTVPLSDGMPLGTTKTIIQLGSGATAITPATGVTLNGGTSVLTTQGANKVVQIYKVSATNWIAVGGFA